jgi:hypothetical protein
MTWSASNGMILMMSGKRAAVNRHICNAANRWRYDEQAHILTPRQGSKMSQIAPPPNPFDVYSPTDKEPFDWRRLCHLLRRASFGVTPKRLEKLKDKKVGEVIDWLIDFDASDDAFDSMVDQLEGFVNLTQSGAVASY